MSRWWRAYDEAVDDPKLILLSDKAHRAWFNLMCIASLHDGVLPDIKIVAVKLRLSVQRAASVIAELVHAGLFDRRDDGAFEPHNWSGRQYKSDVTDPTAAQRMQRYRENKRNGERNNRNAAVTVTPPREQKTEADTEQKDSEPIGSGAAAPPDPSEPERQLFARGREILGKSSGGQISNLLKTCGGNVALARSKIELAATKDRPAEFVAGTIRAGPVAKGSFARPLTQHQIERENSRKILDDLDNFANGGSQGQADSGLLRLDSGDGPESLHGGFRGTALDLSPSRTRQSG